MSTQLPDTPGQATVRDFVALIERVHVMRVTKAPDLEHGERALGEYQARLGKLLDLGIELEQERYGHVPGRLG